MRLHTYTGTSGSHTITLSLRRHYVGHSQDFPLSPPSPSSTSSLLRQDLKAWMETQGWTPLWIREAPKVADMPSPTSWMEIWRHSSSLLAVCTGEGATLSTCAGYVIERSNVVPSETRSRLIDKCFQVHAVPHNKLSVGNTRGESLGVSYVAGCYELDMLSMCKKNAPSFTGVSAFFECLLHLPTRALPEEENAWRQNLSEIYDSTLDGIKHFIAPLKAQKVSDKWYLFHRSFVESPHYHTQCKQTTEAVYKEALHALRAAHHPLAPPAETYPAFPVSEQDREIGHIVWRALRYNARTQDAYDPLALLSDLRFRDQMAATFAWLKSPSLKEPLPFWEMKGKVGEQEYTTGPLLTLACHGAHPYQETPTRAQEILDHVEEMHHQTPALLQTWLLTPDCRGMTGLQTLIWLAALQEGVGRSQRIIKPWLLTYLADHPATLSAAGTPQFSFLGVILDAALSTEHNGNPLGIELVFEATQRFAAALSTAAGVALDALELDRLRFTYDVQHHDIKPREGAVDQDFFKGTLTADIDITNLNEPAPSPTTAAGTLNSASRLAVLLQQHLLTCLETPQRPRRALTHLVKNIMECRPYDILSSDVWLEECGRFAQKQLLDKTLKEEEMSPSVQKTRPRV